MRLPANLRAELTPPRLRLGFAIVLAVAWLMAIVGGEVWNNPALAVLFGVPAVLVFLVWRTRPWLALGLAFATFMIVLVGAVGASASAIAACSTGWLAVLGAALSPDLRLRRAGLGLVAVYALVLTGTGGIGGAVAAGLVGALPYGAAWAYRRVTHRTERLQSTLVETAQRSEAAERDVLVELERNRLAREVHDVVAHSLAVVIAQADGARFAAETKPESVAPALEAISDTARRALGEVRTMLHDLRTSGEGGVVPGAADLAGLVEGVRGLGVDVDEVVYGEPRPLDRTAGLALYRVAQEALTNAMRHGDRAEPVGFEVDWGDREVVLVVTNAVPDEAVPATERSGHGVTGMRERAADAGGDCTAGVGSNGRFRVRVALPVAVEVREATAEPEPAPSPLLALLGFGEPGVRA